MHDATSKASLFQRVLADRDPGSGPPPARWRCVTGYAVVVLGTALACFWGYWGILENFHEGWYHESAWENVRLLLAQYLWMMLVFQVITAVAVVRPAAGAAAFVLLALLASWRFRGASPLVVGASILAPLLLLGAAAAWARYRRPRRVLAAVGALPTVLVIAVGIEPAWRVAHRYDDGDRGSRVIAVGADTLEWAPAGPGWPTDGVSWDEAVRRARHLRPDGRTLADSILDVWRLPSIEEVVASMHREGRPAGGSWDAAAAAARFARTPDKESPLWDPHSKVIYWWTATIPRPGHALRVAYDGRTLAVPTGVRWGYLGFRAVHSVRAR